MTKSINISIKTYICSKSDNCPSNKCIHKKPHATDGKCCEIAGCSYSRKTAICIPINEEWDK